jgi:hypothetical protein
MRMSWIVRKAPKFLLAAVVFVAVFGFVVMNLWNWLMPPLFGRQVIGFWQAVGLLVLSRILFGGFRGRSGSPMHWRRRMHERWEAMTPEEREKFRTGIQGRCGPFRPPTSESKA